MTLREAKNALREQYLAIRRAMPRSDLAQISAAICNRFLTLASYRYSEHILLYAPLFDEPDIMPIAYAALSAGKTVWFPLCNADNHTMTFHRVTDPDAQLSVGTYGIREPEQALPCYDFALSGSVCIVPAILFDRSGYRLGYGKGYYDRFLPSFGGTVVGAAPSASVIDALPHGRFDCTVDILLTEKGVNLPHAI